MSALSVFSFVNFSNLSTLSTRRKAVWGPKRLIALGVLVLLGLTSNAVADGRHSSPARRARPAAPNSNAKGYRLDKELTRRAVDHDALSKTHAIVTLKQGAHLPPGLERFTTRKLGIINGYVVDLPNGLLKQFAAHPSVFRIHYDRPAAKFDALTSLTVGAVAVNQSMGLTGAGIGIAVIDSGITAWHDDLTSLSSAQYPYGDQRVSAFVDFVNGSLTPYDDNGHGTHVAGLIAGNGYDSNGQKAGIAPGASLVSLKVLDANGIGSISNVIAALEWVLANHATYNIRVVNLSVGAAIRESYWTDPLTLAAKAVVDAGVVVVSAAGNFGRNAAGLPQYGGINAPGNAPWVLTVGASSTNGTIARLDDTMASFSSRGPTYLDWSAKPDLVAPGVGLVSLVDASSTFYSTNAEYLVSGSMLTAFPPYLSLSGTSMAAPIVSGTVALMLQANPSLTPNAVKALLQYTAQINATYDPLAEGAGYLNTFGAVRLAGYYATAQPGQPYPVQDMWGKQIIWGNHLLTGGIVLPGASAWSTSTTWGAAMDANGDNIVWGTAGDGDNIVWGTSADGDNIIWGTALDGDNIVWGTAGDGDNVVWGTALDGDNIVWGTALDGDNIVWGTDCGTADCDNVVWGASDADNIIWGTALDGDNIVWGTALDGDNIVWGTDDGDNVVWGTADGDNIVWGTDDSANLTWATSADGTPVLAGSSNALTDEQVFALLSQAPIADSSMVMMIEDETIAETPEPTVVIMLDPAILFMVDTPVAPPDPPIVTADPPLVTDDAPIVTADAPVVVADAPIVTPEPAIVATPEPSTTPVITPLEGSL
jgi:serine protease AprX